MGKGKGHIPIRSCISCGTKRSKNELVRLVLDGEGRLVRDDDGKRQGRGAYVCKSKSCQEGLLKNKRLGRAFRSKKTITVDQGIPWLRTSGKF